MRRVPWLLLLVGCAGQSGTPAPAVGVRGFGRAPGMAIGTGAPSSPRDHRDDTLEALPLELLRGRELAIPQFESGALPPADAVPCSGCVELQVDVNDINQRDEFALALPGVRLKRVVWTLLVNFNSDQLAVQPFVDGVYGKYTSLHVNTFPLATAVEVVQELDGKAREREAQHVGLKVGSSGAWTGNQTMSVFVSELRIEGQSVLRKLFDAGPEGLQPLTQSRNPRVVFHGQQPSPARSSAAGMDVFARPAAVARPVSAQRALGRMM